MTYAKNKCPYKHPCYNSVYASIRRYIKFNFLEKNQFLGQNAKQNLREYKNFRNIVFLTRKNQGNRKLLLFILNGKIEKLLLLSLISLSVFKPWIMFGQKNMWWQVTRLPYLIPALTICMEALLNKIWAGKKTLLVLSV